MEDFIFAMGHKTADGTKEYYIDLREVTDIEVLRNSVETAIVFHIRERTITWSEELDGIDAFIKLTIDNWKKAKSWKQ